MSEIELEYHDHVAVVTLNRPESLNALNDAAHEQLKAAWTEVKGRPSVRAVMVIGRGRGFCVGMDLKLVGSRGSFRPATSNNIHELSSMTALNNDIWLPTIVAVNGVCAGGGLHFVADADYVVASENASFVDPHVSYGQVSALEPISLLHRIGLGNALALAVLGSAGRIGAAEALRMGLVNEVVAPEQLAERALEVAARASRGSPAAVERTKRAVWASLDLPFSEAMQAGWESIVAHRAHPDALEGPRAFNEKRDPAWVED